MPGRCWCELVPPNRDCLSIVGGASCVLLQATDEELLTSHSAAHIEAVSTVLQQHAAWSSWLPLLHACQVCMPQCFWQAFVLPKRLTAELRSPLCVLWGMPTAGDKPVQSCF